MTVKIIGKKVIITIKVEVYHGTYSRNIKSILENGFISGSCATQDLGWAFSYGDCILKFKYPYSFNIKHLWWFLKSRFSKSIVLDLAGFKPENVDVTLITEVFVKEWMHNNKKAHYERHIDRHSINI